MTLEDALRDMIRTEIQAAMGGLKDELIAEMAGVLKEGLPAGEVGKPLGGSLLRKAEVMEALGVRSKSTFHDLIRQGLFPGPRKLGASAVWPREQVADWLEEFNQRQSESK